MKSSVLIAVLLSVGLTQDPRPKTQDPSPWKQASAGYTYSFPRDHASHPDYKIEWWYYTGNVKAADGRKFGYQLTFFRVGIAHSPANPSKWAVRDLFMTHLAVTDAQGQRYRYAEKLSRGGPGLAGARSDRYHVWNEDWSAELVGNQQQHVLKAVGPQAGVEFTLDEGKAPAINGINGISQKGAREGNASHYYSMTRMPTRGTLTIDGERFAVTGTSWMDHEFGTSFLEPEQRGWDWLAIQLSDNRELMLYQLRRSDGSRDPRSSGTLVDANGKTVHLSNADFTLTPGKQTFTSKNGAVYPLEWSIAVPSQQIELRVTTPVRDQELSLVASTGVAYWEGMIDVAGSQATRPSGGRQLTGVGYLEMTGYHGSLGRVLSGQ
ncbi:MAG TPA: lipocalin-like domain-containing protein [Vicinamibacterales bacterium]|nr:lipocalin-like domain-containing protein [Vicinamibacterales bacterium]